MHGLLLPLLLAFASGAPAAAQLKTTTMPTFSMKHKHLVFFKCDGQPDKVMGRRDERYFGCVNGKVACSDDGVTQSMIAAYEARRDEIQAEAKRRKREFDVKHASKHGRGWSPRSSTTSTRSTRSATSAPAYTVKSTPRPPAQAAPIDADKVRQVTAGTSTDEVISMLGQPKWRLAVSTESWKYSLTSGGTAKLVFEDGKVTSVVLP